MAYEPAMLQRTLKLAVRNEKLETVPAFPPLRVNDARHEYITEGEFAGLMVELPAYLRVTLKDNQYGTLKAREPKLLA